MLSGAKFDVSCVTESVVAWLHCVINKASKQAEATDFRVSCGC